MWCTRLSEAYRVLSKYRKWVRGAITGLVIGWSIIRFFPVLGILSANGVSPVVPIVFLVIDILTAIPYVYGIERFGRGLGRESSLKMMGWGTVVGASFAIPYLYLMAAADQAPPRILYGMIAALVILAVLSWLVQIWLRKRRRRVATARSE